MLFSFLYFAVRALLGLFVRSRRGPEVKDIKLRVSNTPATTERACTSKPNPATFAHHRRLP